MDSDPKFQSLNASTRLVEAVLFAAKAPVSETDLRGMLPADIPLADVLADLARFYSERGVDLIKKGDTWTLSARRLLEERRQLQVVNIKKKHMPPFYRTVLITIALHQPISADQLSTLCGGRSPRHALRALRDDGWIDDKGKFQEPGAPVAWRTTERFLIRLGLDSLNQLPSQDEARGLAERLRNPVPEGDAERTGIFRMIFDGSVPGR